MKLFSYYVLLRVTLEEKVLHQLEEYIFDVWGDLTGAGVEAAFNSIICAIACRLPFPSADQPSAQLSSHYKALIVAPCASV